MRTQHPNLWHPIRFAIMLIVLAWTIYGVCYEPPTDIFGVIWVAMLVTALVPSPLFLKSTSVAILVIASIGDLFTPYAHLGNSLPAQLYAYGMLAYSTNAIIVATLLTYYVVNILLIDPPGPNTNPVAMVIREKPELWERASALLADAGYRGFANFDVKRDPATGRTLFLEVNPRIGRNSYYNCAAGANPMRFCVEDLVRGRHVEPVRVEREVLYTLVPVRLLRRYVRDPELLARVDRLVREGKVFDPQRYPFDNRLRRRLALEATELNQYRKFARYYPEPTETSF